MKLVKNENEKKINEVTDKEAEEAFVKILKWLGEDPTREGLLETPKRVTKAFKEYFKGYKENPKAVLDKFNSLIETGLGVSHPNKRQASSITFPWEAGLWSHKL